MTTLRHQMLAAARARGHEQPEALDNRALSWWLYEHPAAPAEPQSISLEDLAEMPARKGRGKR